MLTTIPVDVLEAPYELWKSYDLDEPCYFYNFPSRIGINR